MADALVLTADADELLRWLLWGLAALALGVVYVVAHSRRPRRRP